MDIKGYCAYLEVIINMLQNVPNMEDTWLKEMQVNMIHMKFRNMKS